MNYKFCIMLFCSMILGCTKLDNYLLGTDNTPQPKELKQIPDKIKVSQGWAVPVGTSSKNREYLRLQPVILGNIIYTADQTGLVQAINRVNGKMQWSTSLHHGLVSGPAIADGFVALGTSNSAIDVLDQTSGKLLWHRKVSGEVLSPPAISAKKVIVKTIDGKVYTFNAEDGKKLWIAEHGSPNLVLKASSSPVIRGKLVLIGFPDGKIDALDVNTGRVLWQRSIAYASGSSDVEQLVDIDADPIVENNVIYLASYQGYIGALSLEDGQFIWKKPASVYKNLALHGNSLYFTDSNDIVWSMDKHNGQVNWKQAALKARVLTEPVLINSNLVVGDKAGYLHFINTKNGEILARSKVSGGISISPQVSREKIYVLTDNGILNKLSVG